MDNTEQHDSDDDSCSKDGHCEGSELEDVLIIGELEDSDEGAGWKNEQKEGNVAEVRVKIKLEDSDEGCEEEPKVGSGDGVMIKIEVEDFGEEEGEELGCDTVSTCGPDTALPDARKAQSRGRIVQDTSVQENLHSSFHCSEKVPGKQILHQSINYEEVKPRHSRQPEGLQNRSPHQFNMHAGCHSVIKRGPDAQKVQPRGMIVQDTSAQGNVHSSFHCGERVSGRPILHQSIIYEKVQPGQPEGLQGNGRTRTGDKPYQCEFCKKPFSRLDNLKTHRRLHTNEKPYQCSYCSKFFNQVAHLEMHKRSHTGERPYQCKNCEKAYAFAASLRRHERIHTGVKPYQCEYCEKCFTQPGDLKRHKRSHTGERPYQCTHCGKAFTRACDLKMHERIHTGVKPYQCEYCEKWFTRAGDLKTHKRSHTGERPYQCAHCEKAFARAGSLKRHKKRLHKY